MLLLTVCTHWCLRDIQEQKQDVNHLVTRRGEKVVGFSYLLSDTIASSCCDQLVAQRVNVCRGVQTTCLQITAARLRLTAIAHRQIG